MRIEEVHDPGQNLTQTLSRFANHAGGEGICVPGERKNLFSRGDVHASLLHLTNQPGPACDSLQASCVAATAGSVGGAVNAGMGDIT